MLEISRLIAEVQERDDVRILPGDPAFALVTLNQLTLEDLTKGLNEDLRQRIAQFSDTVERTEARAGARLARQAKEEAASLRDELKKEIDAARLNTIESITHIDRVHRRSAFVWVGLVVAIALITTFLIGLWVGAHRFDITW